MLLLQPPRRLKYLYAVDAFKLGLVKTVFSYLWCIRLLEPLTCSKFTSRGIFLVHIYFLSLRDRVHVNKQSVLLFVVVVAAAVFCMFISTYL